MQSVIGLGLMVVTATVVVAVLLWLGRQDHLALRMAGVTLSATVATFCAVVALAITADNHSVAELRLSGGTAVLLFNVTAVLASLTAFRGWRRAAVQT